MRIVTLKFNKAGRITPEARYYNARKVISEVYAFLFTAVYCLWAEK